MRIQTSLLSLVALICAAGISWFAWSLLGGSHQQGTQGQLTASGTDVTATAGSGDSEELEAVGGSPGAGGDLARPDLLPSGATAPVGRVSASSVNHSEWIGWLTVEDLGSGAPVVGAQVLEVLAEGGEPLVEEREWQATESDADGRIEVVVRLAFEPDAEKSPRIDLRLRADGYSPAAVAALALVQDASPGATHPAPHGARLVALQRAASLVVDIIGAPSDGSGEFGLWYTSAAKGELPDVQLEWPLGSGERTLGDSVTVKLEAGSGGARRVRLSGLPVGPLSLALAVEGYPLALEQGLRLLPAEELAHTLELKPGETAAGVVVDLETRRPVAGVEVHAIPGVPGISERLDRLPYPGQVTDAGGRYVIAGLPQGSVGVELVTTDGASHPRRMTIVPGNHARQHELRVRGTASLAGKLDVPKGARLVAAQVLVTTAEAASSVRLVDGAFKVLGKGGPGVFAELDASGSFVAERVPSGRKLVIHGTALGMTHGTTSLRSLKLGEEREGIRLFLGQSRPVSFRVVSSTGEAVKTLRASFRGFRYSADQESQTLEGQGNGAKVRGRPSRSLPWVDLSADPSGVFQAEPSLASIKRVRLRWEDRARGDFEWVGGMGDSLPTFELDPDPIVVVQVFGEDGAAVRGGHVSALPEVPGSPEPAASPGRRGKGRQARAQSSKKKAGRGGPRAATDDFGRARLALAAGEDGRLPDRYELRVNAPGYQSVRGMELRPSDALPAGPIEVTMARSEIVLPATVTGRLIRRSGEPVAAPRFDGLRGGSAHVDEHAFVLRGLRPGRAKVVVHAAGFESQALKPVQLGAGDRVDVGEVVMRWASRVDVHVKDSRGKPVKAATVRLTRMSKKETKRSDLPRAIQFPRDSKPRGVFRRMGVARVPWRLVVNHPGHKPFTKVIRVKKALERVEVALEAQP